MSHTPEPWKLEREEHEELKTIVAGESYIAEHVTTATAARIVTCINALATVADPVAVLELVEAARAVSKSDMEALDELDAAVPGLYQEPPEIVRRLAAALAPFAGVGKDLT